MASSGENGASTQLRTDRMRQSTKKVHDHSTGQLKLGLILTSKPLYAETLNVFLPIYAFLEQALERNKKHPKLGQLYPLLDDMKRAPGFQKDVDFYRQGRNLPRLEQVDDYVAYLMSLEETNPTALLAWYYHMYMAIFAGGFIIKKTVAKTMRLTSDEGVQAFVFEAPPKQIRDKLKSIINNIDLSQQEEDLLMEEGPKVFLRNDELMETLRGGVAFKNAEADCCRFITKISVGVLVALAAVSLAFLQTKS